VVSEKKIISPLKIYVEVLSCGGSHLEFSFDKKQMKIIFKVKISPYMPGICNVKSK
jgi:hypothetical protein